MAEKVSERGSGLCFCLRRIGKSEERLVLHEGKQVTLGRGLGVTYQLTSAVSPLMISRTHCIFQQNEEGKWTVMDNKSLNGVWLNKERLESCRAYIVSVGSCIQLGVPLPDKERPEFEYRLVQERMPQAFPLPSAPKTLKTNGSRAKRKLNTEDFEVSTNSSKTKIHRTSIECENPAKSLHRTELAKQPTLRVEDVASEDLPESCDSIDGDTLAPTQQQCRSTLQLSKVRQTMVEIRRLNVQMQEKQMEMQERLNAPHQSQTGDLKDVLAMQKELHELQNQLSNERKEHLQRVQDLKQIYQEEQQKQGERKLAEEEHLREQLAQALQEHTLLMEELNRNKNNFAQIIEAKDKELQETKKEKEEVRAQKEEVLSHMNEVLDNELQCIICSEHFIEAVTLNCAHSFCSYCIKSWRRRKDECPICRQPIHSETRSLVLDNCIDSMVAKLSVEMKERRAKLIKERKALSSQVKAAEPIHLDSDSSSQHSPTLYVFSSSSNSDIDDLEEYDYGADYWEEIDDVIGLNSDYYDEEDDEDDSFLII